MKAGSANKRKEIRTKLPLTGEILLDEMSMLSKFHEFTFSQSLRFWSMQVSPAKKGGARFFGGTTALP